MKKFLVSVVAISVATGAFAASGLVQKSTDGALTGSAARAGSLRVTQKNTTSSVDNSVTRNNISSDTRLGGTKTKINKTVSGVNKPTTNGTNTGTTAGALTESERNKIDYAYDTAVTANTIAENAQRTVALLEGTLNSLQNTVAGLETDYGTNNETLEILRTNVNELRTSVNGLVNTVASQTPQIDDVAGQVRQLSPKIAQLEAAINELPASSSDFETLQSDINYARAQITNLISIYDRAVTSDYVVAQIAAAKDYADQQATAKASDAEQNAKNYADDVKENARQFASDKVQELNTNLSQRINAGATDTRTLSENINAINSRLSAVEDNTTSLNNTNTLAYKVNNLNAQMGGSASANRLANVEAYIGYTTEGCNSDNKPIAFAREAGDAIGRVARDNTGSCSLAARIAALEAAVAALANNSENNADTTIDLIGSAQREISATNDQLQATRDEFGSYSDDNDDAVRTIRTSLNTLQSQVPNFVTVGNFGNMFDTNLNASDLIVKKSQLNSILDEKGYRTATDLESAFDQKYATAGVAQQLITTQVAAQIDAKNFVTQADIDSSLEPYATKKNMDDAFDPDNANNKINAALEPYAKTAQVTKDISDTVNDAFANNPNSKFTTALNNELNNAQGVFYTNSTFLDNVGNAATLATETYLEENFNGK